jgi:iron complex transport system permease protein
MKITLDISKLVEEGKLTREEADKLTALAAHDTGSLGINILIGFGVIAIAAGAVALVPTPLTAVSLGLALFAQGARSCSTACSNGSCSGRFALSLAR